MEILTMEEITLNSRNSGSHSPPHVSFHVSMCALLFFLLSLAISASAQTFYTGAPEMASASVLAFPLDSAAYQRYADSAGKYPNQPVILKLPAGLSPEHRFGYNFVVGEQNRGWILDRDAKGYLLYLDFKGDGDLSRAAPVRLHDESGTPRADIPIEDGDTRWTCRFQVEQWRPKAGAPEQTVVRIFDSTRRSGVIELAGRKIPFVLSGLHGRYGILGTDVSFDRDGSGKSETYKLSDRWVNLAGKTYEFHEDPLGASLTLRQTDSRADRPSLDNGTPIPDIELTDLQGKTHQIRANPAEVTLIEFWATSCGPCRAEMPALKTLYERLPRTRFEILGVSSDESLGTLRKFLAEFAVSWTECREVDEGPAHQILRIDAIPAYFLLAKDGEILDHWVGSGDSVKRIDAVLAARGVH
jgi:thiol-disulfide isomerase/thioredoxin